MEFSPAVYEHAAALIGRTPWEVSRDGSLLVKAHAEAYRRYHHSPVVPGIDIYNLEPEAYGAPVVCPEGTAIPAISTHICTSASDVPRLRRPSPARDGRLPMVIQSGVELRRLLPDAEIRIPVSGPFSIASNLVGFEPLLCDAATDGDATVAALSFIVDNQLAFCREIARAGLDATFFDSAAAPPLLSPRLFEALVLPSLTRFVGEAAAIFGHRVACVIGGDTYPILELLLKSGTGYVICPSETDQTAFMARMRDRPDVTVRINMEPGIIARGISEEVFREVDRVARLVTGRPHTLIGTGVLPFETRPDVVMKVHEYVLTL